MAATNGVRMRIRRTVASVPEELIVSATRDDNVKCAIGERMDGDSSDGESASRSVVWSRGGRHHAAVCIKRDSLTNDEWIDVSPDELHEIPSTLCDEMALLTDDMAAAIGIARIVESRQLQRLCVLTTGSTAATAFCLAKYVKEVLVSGQEDSLPISVGFMDGRSTDTRVSMFESLATVSQHDTKSCAVLDFDGCIDLCCGEESLEFATSQVDPLGTLILLDRRDTCVPDTKISIPLNMNTVVVNELTLVHVGDYRTEIPAALDFLSKQSPNLQPMLSSLVQ